ncbi:hypothetical protein PINS_up014286 [Pythium insidiosum]|nr:hypothetical protein PINS_up014286 [Pythium insidiosum]
MYLPTPDEAERRAITSAFERYVALYRDMMEPFGGTEHWAKLEWPEDAAERQRMRERLAKRYPLDAIRQARASRSYAVIRYVECSSNYRSFSSYQTT